MLVRIPGSAQRYYNTETGKEISRRQRDVLVNKPAVIAREARYQERVRERRSASAYIKPEVQSNNKRYWLQRYSEQYALRHPGMTDREALEIAKRPGSTFSRLWAEVEREGFAGGEGSAVFKLGDEAGVYKREELEGGYRGLQFWTSGVSEAA